MIEVYVSKRADRDRRSIVAYLWKSLPCGTDEEIMAAFRIIQAERAKIDQALEQIGTYPESGPVKAGVIRKIVIPESRYTMAYRIAKDFKRVTVLSIRGAQRPTKW